MTPQFSLTIFYLLKDIRKYAVRLRNVENIWFGHNLGAFSLSTHLYVNYSTYLMELAFTSCVPTSQQALFRVRDAHVSPVLFSCCSFRRSRYFLRLRFFFALLFTFASRRRCNNNASGLLFGAVSLKAFSEASKLFIAAL